MELKKTILIVDHLKSSRDYLKNILSDEYHVLEAATCEQALDMIQNQNHLSVILLNPDMKEDSNKFLKVHSDHDHRKIPVIALLHTIDVDKEIKLLSLGVSDYIYDNYIPEVIKIRIENTIQHYESNDLFLDYKYDTLTGVYTKEMFYKKANQFLAENEDKKYDLLCVSIDNFKIVNDMFGSINGNKIIQLLADDIKCRIGNSGIYGRIGPDIFAVMIPHREEYKEEFIEQSDIINKYPININLILKYGIYVIEELGKPISEMCHYAKLAIKSIKNKPDTYFAYYEPNMGEELIIHQKITNTMESSLANGDFKVYFQPKYEIDSGKIIGAEALVRWIHPEMGVISPEVFIPLFEKNGFISKLDQFIWEKTCECIRNWKIKGLETVPISVNLSLTDLYDPKLLEFMDNTVNKYGLSPQNFHLEITESAYMKDSKQMTNILSSLRMRNYKIEMDDFGTGYSSLNMLSELPIDILKLDMSILQNKQNKNSVNILGFMISLAKWLNLMVIAEGVESKQQIDMLKSMDCTYVQGYYFAKPMPADEFEMQMLKDGCISPQIINSHMPLPLFHYSENKPIMLIVDDVDINRIVLKEMFNDKYAIAEAQNGEVAYEYLNMYSDKIEVVLLDLLMPVMDGFQLIKLMRSNPKTKDIPIVVTSSASEDSEEKTLKLGANEFLSKPYRSSIAKNRVQNVIENCKYQKMQKAEGK